MEEDRLKSAAKGLKYQNIKNNIRTILVLDPSLLIWNYGYFAIFHTLMKYSITSVMFHYMFIQYLASQSM
jgi:hypothetical protein